MTIPSDRYRKRRPERAPFLAPATAFVTGIVLAHFLAGPTWLVVAAVVSAVSLGLSLLVFRPSGPRRAALAGVLGLAAAVGFWRMVVQEQTVSPDDVSGLLASTDSSSAPVHVLVRGIICARPDMRRIPGETDPAPSYTRFDLAVEGLEENGTWCIASGKVRVSVPEAMAKLSAGDRVECFGRLRRPAQARNPGEFDYAHYLSNLGIRSVLSVRTSEAVKVLQHPAVSLYAVGAADRLLGRSRVFQSDPRRGGVLRALLFGERSAVDPQVERAFRRSGTVHILAVSGLNVAMILGTLWYLLRAVGVPERMIAVVVMTAAVAYAAVAGMQPSIVRAVLVAVVYCGGVLLGRSHSFLNSLALAAVIILVVTPGQILNAGFQLSFLAVLGIVAFAGLDPLLMRLTGGPATQLMMREVARWRLTLNRAVVRTLSVSIGALVLTLPFSAYHFRIVTLLAPLFNILLLPVIWLVMTAGFAVMALPVFPLTWVSGAGLSVMLGIVESAARIPGACFQVPRPPAWWVVAFYALVAMAVWARRVKVRPGLAAAAVGTLAGASLLWVGLIHPAQDELTVLDVGQGCATVVTTRAGTAMVYDCGSTDRSEVGGRVVAPFLLDRAFQRVDLLVLSHPDADHVNGVASLLEVMPVTRALLSPSFQWSQAGVGVMALLSEAGTRIDVAREGTKAALSPEVVLEVLHPGRDDRLTWSVPVNDRSLVLGVKANGGTAVLWGDAGTDVIRLLYGRGVRADIVLLPHHGSIAVPEIEQMTSERAVALVSAREGFLRPRWRQALSAPGSEVYSTWDHGALSVRLDGPAPVPTPAGPAGGTERAVRGFIKAAAQPTSAPASGEDSGEGFSED